MLSALTINFHTSYKQDNDLYNACKEISDFCNTKDLQNNSFFIDDEYDEASDYPWLYYATNNSDIIGFISIYIIDSYNLELCGFVLPKYRRNKVATKLFSMMTADFPSYSFQCSMMPGNNSGKLFVNQMGFEHCSTECSMYLSKEEFIPSNEELSLQVEKQDDGLIIHGHFNMLCVGHVFISDSGSTVCIHDVEIYEKYRGNGYGYKLIMTILNYIFKKYSQVLLHVTKDNIPAHNLYKKVGFKTLETLEYYLL